MLPLGKHECCRASHIRQEKKVVELLDSEIMRDSSIFYVIIEEWGFSETLVIQ